MYVEYEVISLGTVDEAVAAAAPFLDVAGIPTGARPVDA